MDKENLSKSAPSIETLGLTRKSFAALVALYGAMGNIQAAEVPNGSDWKTTLKLMREDLPKPYEVGMVMQVSGKKYKSIGWQKGRSPLRASDAPEVAVPAKLIAQNIPASNKQDEYVCVLHTHYQMKVDDLVITSMPPSPGDFFSAIMTSVSHQIPERGVGKIKHGMLDTRGVWSFRTAESPESLRARIKTGEDLKQYISGIGPTLTAYKQAALKWTVVASEQERRSEYQSLSDEAKMRYLTAMPLYAALQKAAKDAGFVIRYASHDAAEKAAPCDEKIGK